MHKFVFLDRDGTLVQDEDGYTHRVEDYVRLPGVVEGLVHLAGAGFRFAIVTNQSGIGRHYYSDDDFQRFQSHLMDDLSGHGIEIDATFYCPHVPDAGCECRKPNPGMLWQARDKLSANLAESWIIGDSARDVRLARRAGLRGAILVLTGNGKEAREELPDSVTSAPDFESAAAEILKRSE